MLDGKGREERKLPTVGLPSYLTVLGKEKVVNGLSNKLTDARTQFLPDRRHVFKEGEINVWY